MKDYLNRTFFEGFVSPSTIAVKLKINYSLTPSTNTYVLHFLRIIDGNVQSGYGTDIVLNRQMTTSIVHSFLSKVEHEWMCGAFEIHSSNYHSLPEEDSNDLSATCSQVIYRKEASLQVRD